MPSLYSIKMIIYKAKIPCSPEILFSLFRQKSEQVISGSLLSYCGSLQVLLSFIPQTQLFSRAVLMICLQWWHRTDRNLYPHRYGTESYDQRCQRDRHRGNTWTHTRSTDGNGQDQGSVRVCVDSCGRRGSGDTQGVGTELIGKEPEILYLNKYQMNRIMPIIVFFAEIIFVPQIFSPLFELI